MLHEKKGNKSLNNLSNQSDNSEISKEISERMRKRKCFADKELEEMNTSGIILDLVEQKRPKQRQLDETSSQADVSTLTKSSILKSESTEPTENSQSANPSHFFDSFGRYLAFYAHLAGLNYTGSIPFLHNLNLIDYYGKLILSGHLNQALSGMSVRQDDDQLNKKMGIREGQNEKREARLGKLTNFSVDALLGTN
jgi:hypothetical protein